MKLYQKIALILIATQAVFLSAEFWFARDTVLMESRRMVQMQRELAEDLLEKSLATGLIVSDYAFVDEILKEAVSGPLVDGVVLQDGFGAQFSSGDQTLLSKNGPTENLHEISVAVDGAALGTLRIAYSQNLTEDIRKSLDTTVLYTALAGIAIAVCSSLVIALAIASRLSSVSLMARKMAAGDFETENTVTGNDEISDLAKTVRTMALEISHKNREFQALVNATPGSIYRTFYDPRTQRKTTEFLQNGFGALFGKPLEELNEEETPKELVNPDDFDAWDKNYNHSFANGETRQFEFRVTNTAGTARWVLDTSSDSLEPDGTIARHGVHIDITSLKEAVAEAAVLQAETAQKAEELAQSERDYRLLAETMPAVIGLTSVGKDDLPSGIEYISPRTQEIFGCSVDDIMEHGYPWSQVHEDDRIGLRMWVKEAASQCLTSSAEFRYRHPAKGWIWIQILARHFKQDDGTLKRLAIFTDVNERKLAELEVAEQRQKLVEINAELTESRNFYSDFLENLPGLVFRNIVTKEGKPLSRKWLSPNVTHQLGYSMDQLNDPEFCESIMTPEDVAHKTRNLIQAIERKEPVSAEYQMRHGDGSIRWFSAHGTVASAGDGNFAFNGIAIDITDRKNAEAMLDQKSQELADSLQALEDTNTALNESREYYKDILDNVPGVVFRNWVSKDLKTTRREFVSPAVSEILGISVEDFMATDTMTGMIVEEDLETREEALRQAARSGEQVEYELRVNHADGTIHTFRYLALLRSLPDGNHLYSGVALDVTKEKLQSLKLAELNAELQKSQEYYKDILDNVPGVVFRNWVSEDLTTLQRQFASPIIEEVFGIPLEQYMREDSMDHLVVPEDRGKRREMVLQGAKSGDQMDYELRMFHVDGTVHTFRFISRMRPLPDGGYNFSGIAIDVTETKEHERVLQEQSEKLEQLNAELAESREYYRDIVETLPGVVFRNKVSKDWAFVERTFLSDSAERQHGFPIESLKDPDFFDSLFDGDIRNRRSEALQRAMETGERIDFESRIRNAKGDYRWYQAFATVKPLPDGTYSYNGLYIDVTDRKEAEFELARKQEDLQRTNARLEESQRLYDEIVSAMPGAIFRARVETETGTMTTDYITDKVTEFFGYSLEELGQPGFVQKLLHPDDREKRLALIKRGVCEGISEPTELRYRHVDGSYRWITIAASVQTAEDGYSIWHGVMLDSTARRLAEQSVQLHASELQRVNRKLQESEAQYREIVETIPGVVFRTIGNRSGEIIRRDYLSPQTLELFGYTAAEMLQFENPKKVVHEGDRKLFNAKLSESATNGTPLNFDYRYVRADGGTGWMMVNATTKTDDTGHVLWHGVQLDITDKKKAEHALEDINRNLEVTVRERTKDLSSANENLTEALEELQQTQDALVQSEKMASLGQLVAGVAHEINTPIGVSLTAITNLADKSKETLTFFEDNNLTKSRLADHFEIVRQSNEIILANLDRASQLIRSFKQVAVDQTSQEDRDVDLDEYTHEILRSLSPVLRPLNVAQYVNMPKGVHADLQTGHYAQILTNLVNNAATHAFPKDRAKPNELSILGEVSDGQLALRIIDNGSGMPPGVRARIFDPFYTTRRSSGGTGLGMHIVYNLVTQGMGGTIECDSEEGEGTEFTIKIPLRVSHDASEKVFEPN